MQFNSASQSKQLGNILPVSNTLSNIALKRLTVENVEPSGRGHTIASSLTEDGTTVEEFV